MFVSALEQENGHPLTRVKAGKSAGLLYVKEAQWVHASAAFGKAVKLMTQVSPRSLTRDDQQYALTELSGLSALAASAILQATESAPDALSVLEAGRGVIAGLSMDLRTDLSELESINPTLFNQYTELRNRLSMVYTDTTTAGSDIFDSLSLIDSVAQRLKVVEELERVEQQIRDRIPGYRDFQRPPQPNYFTDIAKCEPGPLVAFNITEIRCDAIIVDGSEKIRSIPLTTFNLSTFDSLSKQLIGDNSITRHVTVLNVRDRNKQLQSLLKWLWEHVVRPVLLELKLLSSVPPKKLPRIFWVTSGRMGLMPLHAAGSDWDKSRDNTASHVVSSYIPTFKSLRYAREQSRRTPRWSDQKYLFITMPETTGDWGGLDVTEETNAIRKTLQDAGIIDTEILETPSKNDVLDKLRNSTVIHFACHGKSDSTDPSNSRLYLADDGNGVPQELTVRDLAATSIKATQLAYLSACSTAEISSEELLDEYIHLASGFLLVGFPHVIGTMWQAFDSAAKDVSQLFYKELVKLNKDRDGSADLNEAFAYAFHEAVSCVREGRIEGKRRRHNAGDNVLAWAPFIHMGC